MKRALVALLLCACNMAVRVDPEGYRCDPGGVCPAGYQCVNDVCHRGTATCAGVVCNAAPASSCVGAAIRTWAGHCDQTTGSCVYDSTDLTCAAGCSNAACVDACVNVTCSSPPTSTCVGTSTWRSYASMGTCTPSTGRCAYAETDTTCAQGCSNGACVGVDFCANVTCQSPPTASCQGSVQRTWSASGSCDAGVCSYSATDFTCAQGCVDGACLGTSLTFTQIGPRLPFGVTALDVAPGSNGDTVVAVGVQGQVATWDAGVWAVTTTPTSQSDLTSVAFVSPATAVLVGQNRSAFTWRAQGLTPLTLPASGSASFVGVHGRSETGVLVVDDQGGWYKGSLTASWTSGNFPSADGPYTVRGVYVDESGRERVAGLCGTPGFDSSCIAYRNPATSSTFIVDTDFDSLGISTVGGSFDLATDAGSDGLVGKSNLSLARHANSSGAFTSVSPTPGLDGDDVVGISAQGASSVRPVYVLTSSGARTGGLYRLTRGTATTSITSELLLTARQSHQALSPTADAQAVLFADSNVDAGATSVYRRRPALTEALDLAEDFAAVTVDAAQALVLVTIDGAVAVERPGGVYNFTRGPPITALAAEGRQGATVLIAGQDRLGNGVLERFALGSFTSISVSAPNTAFNAVCRVSPTEAYAVGTGGAIFVVNATTATRMSSSTTDELLDVDCTGAPVACGRNGTVVQLNGNVWSALPSAGPRAVTSCRSHNGIVFAVGDNWFGRLEASATQWTVLAAKPGLTHLLVRSASELYAVAMGANSTNEIEWFDGNAWHAAFSTHTHLGGGVQIGARVVWGGSVGALVEGR